MNETSKTTDKEVLLQAIELWLRQKQQQAKSNFGQGDIK